MDKQDYKISPETESIRAALKISWSEHQHTRDQSWKALQLVLAFTIGAIFFHQQFQNRYVTLAISILVMASSLSGILLTLHLRKYQSKKFEQISRFEEALHISQLIGVVSEPRKVKWYDSVSLLTGGNTPVFMIRIYLLISLVGILLSLSVFI
ncbi:MAG: hypothetical protein AAGF93_08885 [Cyanobacteria bacterium P01_H01_bin.105]